MAHIIKDLNQNLELSDSSQIHSPRFLLQMAGFPGSGKSTLAKLIGKTLGAVIIDRDIIKSSLMNYNIAVAESSSISYQLVYDLANFYLSCDLNVIIDTPCYYENIIQRGQSLAQTYSVNYKFIECQVEDFKLIEERILNRINMTSQITKPTLVGFMKAREGAKRPIGSKYLIVDTSKWENISIQKISDYLIEQ